MKRLVHALDESAVEEAFELGLKDVGRNRE